MKIFVFGLSLLSFSQHSFGLLKVPSAARVLTGRVVPTTVPILYVYDHCPFCVRVRLAFGLKNIKHELRFLANDDSKKYLALLSFKSLSFVLIQSKPQLT